MTDSKKPQPYSRTALGILNPWGDVWTSTVFDSEEAARGYLESFWAGNPNADLSRYRFVPVEVTVTPLSTEDVCA